MGKTAWEVHDELDMKQKQGYTSVPKEGSATAKRHDAQQAERRSESSLKGSRVNYYLVQVEHPNREDEGVLPYQAECEDITRALKMTPEEFCEFKALWRTAAARLGNGKPGRTQLDQAIYDAEKRIHYASIDLRNYKRLKEQQ